MEEAFRRIADHLDPKNRANETKKALRPENVRPPLISTRNPRGDKDFPRPTLRWKRINIPYRAEPEDFDREELDLLNLMEKGQYWIDRNDGSQVVLSVRVVLNDITGDEEELWFISANAFSAENRLLLPPLRVMLRQMLGDKADGVMPIKKEQALVDEGKLAVSQGE